MNAFIKTIIIVWFAFSAVVAWISLAVLGFILCFTPDLSFMYNVTPFIGLTFLICIIKCATFVYRSNPTAYIDSKIKWLEKLLT